MHYSRLSFSWGYSHWLWYQHGITTQWLMQNFCLCRWKLIGKEGKKTWGLFPSKRVKSSTDQCKRPLHSVPCSQSHNVIMNAVCLVEEIINTRRMSAPLFSSQGWRFYKDFKFILFNVRNHYASVQWRKQLQQSNQKLFSSNSFKWL